MTDADVITLALEVAADAPYVDLMYVDGMDYPDNPNTFRETCRQMAADRRAARAVGGGA